LLSTSIPVKRFCVSNHRTVTITPLALLLLAAAVINLCAAIGSLAYTDHIHRTGTATADAFESLALGLRQAEVHYKNQIHEWKNTLLRGHDPDDFALYHQAMLQESRTLQSLLQSFEADAAALGFPSDSIAQFADQQATLTEAYLAALSAHHAPPISTTNIHSIDAQVRGIDRDLQLQLTSLVQEAAALAVHQQQLTHQTATRAFTIARSVVTASFLVQVVIVIVLIVHLRRSPNPTSG